MFSLKLDRVYPEDTPPAKQGIDFNDVTVTASFRGRSASIPINGKAYRVSRGTKSNIQQGNLDLLVWYINAHELWSVAEAIVDAYDALHKILFVMVQTVRNKSMNNIRNIVTQMYKDIDITHMLEHYLPTSTALYLPSTVNIGNYGDSDISKNGNKDMRDTTYIKTDYYGLAGLTVLLQPIIPIWLNMSRLPGAMPGIKDTLSKGAIISGIDFINSAEFYANETVDPYNKLKRMVRGKPPFGKNGTIEKKTHTAIGMLSLSSEELPDYIITYVLCDLIQKYDFTAQKSARGRECNAASNLASTIKKCNEDIVLGKLNKDKVCTTSAHFSDNSSGDESKCIIDNFHSKQDRSDGSRMVSVVAAGHIDYLCRYVGVTNVDNARKIADKFNHMAAEAEAGNDGNLLRAVVEPTEGQLTIIKNVMYRHIQICDLDQMGGHELSNIRAAVAQYLYEAGHPLLAAIMIARPAVGPDGRIKPQRIHTVLSKTDKDKLEELSRHYPRSVEGDNSLYNKAHGSLTHSVFPMAAIEWHFDFLPDEWEEVRARTNNLIGEQFIVMVCSLYITLINNMKV